MNFDGIIQGWYQKNKRDLPWRENNDPYRIWLSEIILQQTRISQGTVYYLNFLEAFPEVSDLAQATENRVLKLWQGLGYYSRALNLLHTAREVDAAGGQFPDNYRELLKLKGIGPYTAAAIASISFGEERAAVDGNVSRLIARLYNVSMPVNGTEGIHRITSIAVDLMAEAAKAGIDPGQHNQAMMEFGALQCIPGKPDCSSCVLKANCAALKNNKVHLLPAKKPRNKTVHRWLYFYILSKGTKIFIQKRDESDIWKSLYQFPLKEASGDIADPGKILSLIEEDELSELRGTGSIQLEHISDSRLHQLTHQTLHVRFLHVKLAVWPRPLPSGWIETDRQLLNNYPVPRLLERYLDSLKNMYL